LGDRNRGDRRLCQIWTAKDKRWQVASFAMLKRRAFLQRVKEWVLITFLKHDSLEQSSLLLQMNIYEMKIKTLLVEDRLW
jgi:hypothetical protein